MNTFRQYGLLIGLMFLALCTTSAQAAQPTIAVLDFSMSKPLEAIWMSADQHRGFYREHTEIQGVLLKTDYTDTTSMLTSDMVNALVASHKFTVVARDQVDAILKEQKFIASGNVKPSETNRLGKLLGADYLVTGQIEALQEKVYREHIPYVNETRYQRRGTLAINIQVIDSKTGQIVAAYPVRVNREVLPQQDELESKKLFLLGLRNQVAKRAANKIIAACHGRFCFTGHSHDIGTKR